MRAVLTVIEARHGEEGVKASRYGMTVRLIDLAVAQSRSDIVNICTN
jgi:hypothetical protein